MAADDATGEPLSPDDVFHLLQNRRRRRVLRYLCRYDDGDGCDMRDVVESIAAREHDTTVEALRSKERQRVYIALYQTHFPKLADHGVIEYNQARGWLSLTPEAEQLIPYLPDRSRPSDQSIDAPPDAASDDAAPEASSDETGSHASPSVLDRSVSSLFDLAALLGTGVLLALSAAGSVPSLPTAGVIFTAFVIAAVVHYVV